MTADASLDRAVADLAHPSPARRKAAAQAIGQTGRASAAAGLLRLLDDKDRSVVTTALWALGRAGSGDDVPAVTRLLGHADARVARAAIWATAQLGGGAAAGVLATQLRDVPPGLLDPLLVALDHLPPALAVAAVVPLLHEQNGPTRSRASQALLRWPSDSAAAVRAHLIAAPSHHDPAGICRPTCRRACAYVLAHTGTTPEDCALLIALAADADPRTRAHALTGLRRLGGEQAWDMLVRLLDDDRRDIQKAALAALLQDPQPLTPGVTAALGRLEAEERPHLRALFARRRHMSGGREPEELAPERAGLDILPLAVALPRSRLIALVAPGLEGVAAGELGSLEGVQKIGRVRGRIFFAWGGPLARLLALRTVGDVLLDGGALSGEQRSGDEDLLTRAVNVWAGLQGYQPPRAYIRIGRHVPEREALRTQASAALAHLGITTERGPADERALLTLEVVAATRATASSPLSFPRLAIRLTETPLGRRPLPGGDVPASLNATIAAAMIRLLAPPGGEVFLDPMCGAGTLLQERVAFTPPPALLLGGDRDEQAVQRTTVTLGGRPARIVVWDAGALPIEDESVLLAACNPPHGRRVGNHQENRLLYPRLIAELYRVLRPGGRAALITGEKTLLEGLLAQGRWQVDNRYTVEAGGLTPTIYLIERR